MPVTHVLTFPTDIWFAKYEMRALVASQPRWQRIILLVILGYEALGGIVGGVLLIVAPDGHLMDMPVSMMHGIFPDFLIPGIILLGLGLLNAFAFVSVLRRSSRDWLITGLALGGYYIWFIAEIIILQELHWLHIMWGLPVLLGWILFIPFILSKNSTATLLSAFNLCGILSSVWYIVINAIVPFFYDGYSIKTQTVSELSAIGSPTRILWVLLATLYPLLLGAFGWALLNETVTNRRLRNTGILIVIYCVVNLFWPPMHIRGASPTLTDTLHIVWASVTVILMILMMCFGAGAFGKNFRNYSIGSLALLIIFGILTFLESPNIPTNGPTPMIGIWERVNIGIFLIWIIVLSIRARHLRFELK